MSNDFFWGLTVRDFQNAFWNDVNDFAILFGGMAVAAVANIAARSIIPNADGKKSGGMKHLVCTVIGIGTGVLVSFHYADRLHHVTFAAEKALKFVVISLVSGAIGLTAGPLGGLVAMITTGGAFGYFGRSLLRFGGAVGAVSGSVLATCMFSRK
jgi:hypothetical protein